MKRGREYHDFGKEYSLEKRDEGKQYHLLHNIEADGKNIKLQGTLYTPVLRLFHDGRPSNTIVKVEKIKISFE